MTSRFTVPTLKWDSNLGSESGDVRVQDPFLKVWQSALYFILVSLAIPPQIIGFSSKSRPPIAPATESGNLSTLSQLVADES